MPNKHFKPKTAHVKKVAAATRVRTSKRAAMAKAAVNGVSARQPVAKMADKLAKLKKGRGAAKIKTVVKTAAEKEEAEHKVVRIGEIVGNVCFSDFISKNVGKRAIDVIKLINAPKTDEEVAADLNVKINEIRRILNVLDSYGVARYDTNKDNKGWLTFRWYLNMEKLVELDEVVKNKKPESSYKLQEGCNDFFFCTKCYKDQKVVLPFDAAFEHEFKCDNCGGKLKLMDRNEATQLLEQETTQTS